MHVQYILLQQQLQIILWIIFFQHALGSYLASLLSFLHVASSSWYWNSVRVQDLWCSTVKLWFGLRAGVAGPGIVRAHVGRHCRRVPCQHTLGRAVIWPLPEWVLCFCVSWLCLGLSLISTPYLFSRSRVTCLRSWSPFFHTTNALWQQQPPPSKAFSSLQECLISQVCLQLKTLRSPWPTLSACTVFSLHLLKKI